MKFIINLRALLIALWLGAALFFIGVAQSSFAVLPTRELAGLMVNRTLMIVNISGLVIAGILLLTSFFIKRPEPKAFVGLDGKNFSDNCSSGVCGRAICHSFMAFDDPQSIRRQTDRRNSFGRPSANSV